MLSRGGTNSAPLPGCAARFARGCVLWDGVAQPGVFASLDTPATIWHRSAVHILPRARTLIPATAPRLSYNFALLSLSAFAMTETELKLIAAAAMMGLRRMPKNG